MRMPADARRFSCCQYSLIFPRGIHNPESGVYYRNAASKYYALLLLYCIPLNTGRQLTCWNPYEERLEEIVHSGGSRMELRGVELEEDSVPGTIDLLPSPAEFNLSPTGDGKFYRSNRGQSILFFPGAVSAVFFSEDGSRFQQLTPSHRFTSVHEDYLEFRTALTNIWRSERVAIANAEPQQVLSSQRDHFQLLAESAINGCPIFDRYLRPSSITVTSTAATPDTI